MVCNAIDEYKIFVGNFSEHVPPSQNYFSLPASSIRTIAQEVMIVAYKNGVMLANDSTAIPAVGEGKFILILIFFRMLN